MLKKLTEQTQSTDTLPEGDDYKKFGHLRINSLKREFNAELLPPPALVTRLVQSLNADITGIKGDGILGWDARLVNSSISATDRSIMVMTASGNTRFD